MSGFLLLRKHAEGSAADVYLAANEETQERVLLQVMRPGLVRDDVAYGRFVDQVRRRTALSHPGLLRLAGSRCRADGAVMAVTEPVTGVDLGEWLRSQGTLSPAQVLALVGPLCEALDYLHRRGVVHGNVSPGWIFVSGSKDNPAARLLESGLALLRVGGLALPPSPHVMVSTDHLAPERIKGARATSSSDLYGMGCVMFELLTGAPPFRRRDTDSTRRAHLDAPVPPLPGPAQVLWPVIARCLEKEPGHRFADALQLREALADALSPSTQPLRPVPLTRRKVQQAPPAPALTPAAAAPATSEPAPILAPSQSLPMLGQWVLEAPLGEGGMGRVWLGRHETMGRKVAIKVLKRHWLEDPTQVARFMREAKVVARVKHPNVVEVLDCGQEELESGGDVYIVLELLSGKPLSHLGRGRTLTVPQTVKLVREAALGLQAAHDLGVVHRDVKPDNLFVCAPGEPDERVKVVDFGVARLTETVLKTIERTREGLVVGTPAYMAPEQSCGEPATAQADVYSLATVLYALLAGRLPFDGRSPEELMVKRFKEKAAKLPNYTPRGEEIPSGLWSVVSRGLEKEPEKRIRTMTEFHDLLAPFEEEPTQKGILARLFGR
jgi:serine/threonine protein kinase